MSSKGTNFNAHGALVTCNGFIVVESCAPAAILLGGLPKIFEADCQASRDTGTLLPEATHGSEQPHASWARVGSGGALQDSVKDKVEHEL